MLTNVHERRGTGLTIVFVLKECCMAAVSRWLPVRRGPKGFAFWLGVLPEAKLPSYPACRIAGDFKRRYFVKPPLVGGGAG
jgi:hypothetical protein